MNAITRLVIAAGFAAAFLVAGTAAAQPPGARTDTTAVEQVIDAINPSYETSYDITRQRTDWKQLLDFGTRFGDFDFSSKTNFTIGGDDKRDSQTRNGGTQGTLTYRGIARLPFFLDFRINRNSVSQSALDSENNSRTLTLRTKANRQWLGIRHVVDLSTGYENRTALSGTAKGTSESKDAGIRGTVDWRGSWDTFESLSVNGSVREERATKTSEVKDAGAEDFLTSDTARKSRNVSLDATYDPFAWISNSVRYSNRNTEEDAPLVQAGQGGFENKISENRSLSWSLNLQPGIRTRFLKDVTIGWSMARDENLQDFEIRTDRATEGDGSDWQNNVTGNLLGVDFTNSISRRRTFTNPRISLANETVLKVMEGKLSRKLSRKFDARFNYELRLRQQFFEGRPSEIQDSDELKTKVDMGLTYIPGAKWNVMMGYINENTERIEVNQIRAGETNDEENHIVTININYKLSDKTRIRQNYSIQAAYTTFRFNPGNNRLNATQRIVTNLDSEITPRVSLSLTHNFNLIDSGSFSVTPDGARAFARAARSYRQDLTSRIEYRVADWLTFTASEQFLRTDNVNAATGSSSIRRNLELRQGFNLQRTLGGGVEVRADGSYIRSSTAESYFSLTSSLKKDF